jgi:predicted dehydrogenase
MHMMTQKRYAVVGVGHRSSAFVEPLATRFRNEGTLVAICDSNPARAGYCNERLSGTWGHPVVPAYGADRFEQMVQETRPDIVIVTTVDAFHSLYIAKALQLGCGVICEKPIAINAEQCSEVLLAADRAGKKVRVTFNARWWPSATLIRQVLADGAIGEVIHVDMQYMLDISHGADYFRRWHRDKSQSGGLLVHKSTHHFDLVNWWLDAIPETVFAFGKLGFYGRSNAQKRGLDLKYERYTGQDTAEDPFALKLDDDEELRRMYYEAEVHDGYIRDRNVFSDGVTIEDSIAVLVQYKGGATLQYSLNTFLPYEGFNVAFSGTKGRLEYQERHFAVQGNPAAGKTTDSKCMLYPLFEAPKELKVPRLEGGHGGADPLIQEQTFSLNPPEENLGRNAWHEQGVVSALVGIGANRSIESGLPVKIRELCPELKNATHFHEFD